MDSQITKLTIALDCAHSVEAKAEIDTKWLKVDHEDDLRVQIELTDLLKSQDAKIKKLTKEATNSFKKGKDDEVPTEGLLEAPAKGNLEISTEGNPDVLSMDTIELVGKKYELS
ncbi:unnamed protein product [Ilex paraguariensis]|uniref:Uncharacterized protein n=1 Tax=Ilex paraguariensis TaxID=185542 RepID=A0ABC8RPP3_9AQUA